jgi:tetratricopeptide (TPR) repeat protein
MQMVGLQDHDLALETLDNAVKNLSSSDSAAMSHAQYLRARVLMKLGEEGAAMHALEEAMEASDVALVIALVDSVFKALEDERRFKSVQKYCRLAARRLPEEQRPWSPDAR